jgi:hypothetical protein
MTHDHPHDDEGRLWFDPGGRAVPALHKYFPALPGFEWVAPTYCARP